MAQNELTRIESHLDALLKRTLSGHRLAELSDVLCAYVLAGGKRVRPQLVLWTYDRCAGDQGKATDSKAVMDLACAWELFHAFLLAHDDIIDKGDMRRSQPSLHRRLASLDSGSEVFGVNLAIVGGDLLFTAALQLLHEMELPGDRYRDVLKLFSRVAATTGFGQAIDIVQGHVPLDAVREEELLIEYHWKTAAYTFEGPMLSGAMAAGAEKGTLEAISKYSLSLGQAYQLQNDLIDLSAPAHEGCDLVQGKRTVTLVRARSALSADARPVFDARMARVMKGGREGIMEAELLRLDLLKSGAFARTAELVGSLLAEAEAAAEDGAVTGSLRDGLKGLLQSLKAGYFK